MTATISMLNRTGNRSEISVDTLKVLASSTDRNAYLQQGAGYEHARKIWNGAITTRPELIIVCQTETDALKAIQFTNDHQLSFSVRGGGHNISGLSLPEGGVSINLSQMNQVNVDSNLQTATVKPGALLSDVDNAASLHNLALPLGLAPTTGVIGLSLGGDVGRLSRSYGMTCDSLLSVRVIGASGEILNVSASEHPDLFWAIRGGGENFGLVTEFNGHITLL